MHADLERLIRLQALDLELQGLRRTIDTEDDRRQAIEANLESARAALAAARERLAASQNERRAIEKDLAQVQGRLSRYRDQLMGVKTNKEYHAMQTEIAAAESEVRKLEDQILERLVEADDLGATAKAAETALIASEAEARAAIAALAVETDQAKQRLVTAAAARDEVARALPPDILSTYELVARRRGTAVAQAQNGHCSLCHVRLRPKVYQELHRNEAVIQCDSCQRILFYAPRTEQTAAPPATGV